MQKSGFGLKLKRFFSSLTSREKISVGNTTQDRVNTVLEFRRYRARQMKKKALIGAGVGGVVGVYDIFRNPSFAQGVTRLTLLPATGAIIGATAAYSSNTRLVRDATMLIGKGLYEEAKSNNALHEKLSSKFFVYVNKKGEVKLTNLPRVAGIGYVRLSTKKILQGKY